MVVSAHYLATRAGAEILAAGGNAFDAAVATSLALGVVEPAGSGLGGMAMALVHTAADQQTRAIAAPCLAPRSASPAAVSALPRYRGHPAVAVPTNLLALEHLHREHGRLERRDLFTPAIALAREGFEVTPVLAQLIETYQKPLTAGNAASSFLPEGTPLGIGQRLQQPELAGTLGRLADAGFRDFYEGDVAAALVADMEQEGGFVSSDDLRDAAARVRPPLPGRWSNGDVLTMGPPAGGLALLQLLHMAEAAGRPISLDSPEGARIMAHIVQRARKDRKRLRLKVGDWEPLGAAQLAEPDYARTAVAEIGAGETSHLCTADREGNLVSLTQSIERSFGAAELCSSLGFFYNGFLRAFKVQAERHPHFLRPGAVARSNASPTFLFGPDGPRTAIGCTGSERSTTAIAEVLIRLAQGEAPFEAVHAPRLHATPDGIVLLEDRFSAEVTVGLEADGFSLDRLEAFSFRMGGLQLIHRTDRGWIGVGEPRRDSAASGPRAS